LTLEQSKLTQLPTLASVVQGVQRRAQPGSTTYSLITQGYVFNQYTCRPISTSSTSTASGIIRRVKYALTLRNAGTDKLRMMYPECGQCLPAVLAELSDLEDGRTADDPIPDAIGVTRKQVSAGTLPELNAAELESQVAQEARPMLRHIQCAAGGT